MLKKIFILLLIAFIAIQFFHPKKNISAGTQYNYIGNIFPVPENLKVIFEKACNDCHSNNTVYPWYSHFQPVAWWMNKHILEGKKEFNLDEYVNKSPRFQYHKMEEIAEEIKDGKMPLKSYTWIHKNAILTETEKNELISWSNTIRDSLKARYPFDSLIRKK